MRRGAPPRVGVFGIGLAAYWPQFEGLRERLVGYQQGLEARLRELGAEVVSAGLVDTAEAAREAGAALAGVDLVLLYTATYATSSQVLPAVQAAKAPVVILNLQPTRSLDYEAMTTAEWLANCSACCVPELAGAFTRARIPYLDMAECVSGIPAERLKVQPNDTHYTGLANQAIARCTAPAVARALRKPKDTVRRGSVENPRKPPFPALSPRTQRDTVKKLRSNVPDLP